MQAGGALKVAPVSVRAHVVALQQQQLTANVAKKNQSSSEAQFYRVSIKRSMEVMRNCEVSSSLGLIWSDDYLSTYQTYVNKELTRIADQMNRSLELFLIRPQAPFPPI